MNLAKYIYVKDGEIVDSINFAPSFPAVFPPVDAALKYKKFVEKKYGNVDVYVQVIE